MKVTAFIGSARKKHTYLAAENFLQKLKLQGDIEYEIVVLNDYNLKICQGCKLMLFRLSRTTMNMMLDENYRDYRYYKEKGWFNADFYYPVKLNTFKKTLGRLFDFTARKLSVQN